MTGLWIGFAVLLGAMLALDVGVIQRRGESFRRALLWTGAWILAAGALAAFIGVVRGGQTAGQFLAGYLIEWSLSIDNVFVFLLIFTGFAVPPEHRQRVLFWGIVGAVALRLGFILGGVALLERFRWMVYGFGALLLVTAVRFLREGGEVGDVGDRRVVRAARRVLPLTDGFGGGRLLVREDGRRRATPLFLVLVTLAATDLVFAVDSIPAIFAVSREVFVVFASNAFAVMGLRSLFVVLSGAVTRFRYLRPSLAVLLAFVATKMLLSDVVHIPIVASLAAIVAILGTGIAASWIVGWRGERRAARPG